MTYTKNCSIVKKLIPRYLKGECTKTEGLFVKNHCSYCQKCMSLLQMHREERQKKSRQEILFLSQPKPFEFALLNLKKEKQIKGSPNKSASISLQTISRRQGLKDEVVRETSGSRTGMRIGEMIRWLAILLLVAFALILIIAGSGLFRDTGEHTLKSDNSNTQENHEAETVSEDDYVVEWKDAELEAEIRNLTGIKNRDISTMMHSALQNRI